MVNICDEAGYICIVGNTGVLGYNWMVVGYIGVVAGYIWAFVRFACWVISAGWCLDTLACCGML